MRTSAFHSFSVGRHGRRKCIHPAIGHSVDTENSDFDKGEWKYRFTADSGQETVLTDGEKHTFLIINGGLSAEHIIIENGRAFMDAWGVVRCTGSAKGRSEGYGTFRQDNLRGKTRFMFRCALLRHSLVRL